MAGAYELPDIGNGKKAAQVWVYPVTPQIDLFTEPILVQARQYINIGVKNSTDAQDMLTAMGFDYTAHGKWFDMMAFMVLQCLRPEETEDYHWRDVISWTISSASLTSTGGSENITAYPEPETVQYRAGTNKEAAAYVAGNAIVRIGTS